VKLGEGIMDFIGIDIAKRKFDLSWLSAGKTRAKAFENTDKGRKATA
jgi:hypothetical protein